MATLVAAAVVLCLVMGTAPAGAPHASAATIDPAPASAPGDGVAVPAGRFAVEIVTTSDWTRVQVRPGEFVAHRVVRAPKGVTVETRTDGWRVLNPTGKRVTVRVDAVLNEFTGADPFMVHVDKGWVGKTRLKLTNTGTETFDVVDVVNEVRSRTDANNRLSVELARTELLGTDRLQFPHADQRQLVLAFYYPWFTTYDEPTLTDHPADPRSTARFADVLSMTQQARDHGIDGFIVSWAGEDADGPAFDRAHEAARRTGGLVSGYLETTAAHDADGRVHLRRLFEWTEQLVARDDGSFLRDGDGVPVVFVWQMEQIPAWGWQMIIDELELRGTPVRFVGDTIHDDYAQASWGVHRYDPLGDPDDRAASSQYRESDLRAAALLEGSDPRLHVGGVAPGYDDHLVRDGNPVIERGEQGERYEATWRAALSGDPDWVTITSWNEWYEGTSVEPGVTAGDLALQQTAELSTAWRR